MMSIAKLPVHTSAPRRHGLTVPSSSGYFTPSLSYTSTRRQRILVTVRSVPRMSVQSTEQSENLALPVMFPSRYVSLYCFPRRCFSFNASRLITFPFALALACQVFSQSEKVNAPTGKMGRAVLESAISAGLHPVPVSLGGPEDTGKTIQVGGKEIKVHGTSDRERILSSVYEEYPNLIVVDYTAPSAVNENAELYCKIGVPFVMGTTGGDREQLFKTVRDSNVYAVISPQMGKQVVAFLASLEIAAEQFPGAFAGYNLQAMESHQASKLDTSGTAKAVISCFKKLGVSFELEQIQKIRDPKTQMEMVGVPEEYLSGHAFHMYHLTSPDGTVTFEFQHNVCGRSIYADGTVDAVLFLAKKVRSKADKRIYDMIDVLREGNMR